jgi:2-desacetyl-2-hydroxyethyl bacteriochlorophyllide A dehydrogenase
VTVATSAGSPDLTATAVSFTAPRQVELVAVDLPALGEGEVLVHTEWSGISGGTEMLAYRGELDPAWPLDERLGALAGSFRFPFRYGYSCVGRVERSRAPLAEGRRVFAFHPHQDAFVVPAADLIPVDDVEPRRATLLPLVETALQVVLDAGAVVDDVVVVTGLGAVGLLVAALLRRGGARVVGVEPGEDRRAVAAHLGVRAVAPDELAAVLSDVAPAGVPLLVEASGRPDTLRAGLPHLAHEGEALVVSWYGTKEVTLPLGAEFHRRRLRIRSTQVSTIPAALAGRWTVPRRRAAARDLLAELPLDVLTTHAFAFADAPAAFAAVDEGSAGLVHAALCYT